MPKSKTKAVQLKSDTDYDIPKFSLKSSLYLIGGGVLSTIILPALLSLLNISFNASVVIGNTFVLGYILAYIRFFVETKRGYCKKFWITYATFGLIFGVISYFWLYLEAFI